MNSMCIQHPESKKPYCSVCGEKTITQCPNPNCNQPIKGKLQIEGIVDFSSYHKSAYCDNCGEPYPWTQRSQLAAAELIEFSDSLNEKEKEDFKESIKDLMVQTPKSNLAVAKYKTYIKKAGLEIANGLRDVLTDIVSETIKKSIWG